MTLTTVYLFFKQATAVLIFLFLHVIFLVKRLDFDLFISRVLFVDYVFITETSHLISRKESGNLCTYHLHVSLPLNAI